MNPLLVTCYVNPDLDGVAGAMAYAEFLNKTGTPAVAGMIGGVRDEGKYVLDRFGIQYPMALDNADVYDQVALVDASDLIGLEGKVDPARVVEVIDHRKVNDSHLFPNAKVQIELVGAAATLIAEKFMNANVDISKDSAILVLSAIISNTLNFKGLVTTDRDRVAAEWLQTVAQLPEGYWKELFLAKSNFAGPLLKERIDGDFAWMKLGGKNFGAGQLELIGVDALMSDRKVDIFAILNDLKSKLGLELIFINLVELDGGYNIILAEGAEEQRILTAALGVTFVDGAARREGMILRKQIVPLLKAEMEK